MGEVLSIAEIEARFDSEWVLLEDPETTASQEILGGRLLLHSKDKAEVHRKLREMGEQGPKFVAIFYVGLPPKGMEFVL